MNETINIFENVCNTTLEVCTKSIFEITMQQKEYAFVTGIIYMLGMIVYTTIINKNMSAIKKGFADDITTTDQFWTIATVGYIIFFAIVVNTP